MHARDESGFGQVLPDGESTSGTGSPLHEVTRRKFLRTVAFTASGLCLGLERVLAAVPLDPPAGARFAGLVPFNDEQVAAPGALIGTELDGRLFTDLSK